MTDIDLSPEAVAKMLDGVTPGPWVAEAQGVYAWDGRVLVASLKAHEWGRDWPTLERDRDFIAWAREAVPALAARLAEVEAERDELRAAIFEGTDYWAILSNGNFVEMVETLHAARRYGVARAEAAEAAEALARDPQNAARVRQAAKDAAELGRLRGALQEATEIVRKAYVAATMEAINAGPSHPLKDQIDKWRVRCMNAQTACHAALTGDLT